MSPGNPLKPEPGAFATRLASARIAAAHHPFIRVSDIEQRLGTRYTIDTVMALKRRFPRARFVWLMGSDNLVQFARWRRWQEIANTIPIAVVRGRVQCWRRSMRRWPAGLAWRGIWVRRPR